MILENCHYIAELSTQVCSIQEIQPEIKMAALKIVESWIIFGNAQLLSLDKTKILLMESIKSDNAKLRSCGINALIRGLEYSRYAKLLNNMSFTESFNEFKGSWIESYLMALIKCLAEVVVKVISKGDLGEIKDIAELTYTIADNYVIILLRVINIFNAH